MWILYTPHLGKVDRDSTAHYNSITDLRAFGCGAINIRDLAVSQHTRYVKIRLFYVVSENLHYSAYTL